MTHNTFSSPENILPIIHSNFASLIREMGEPHFFDYTDPIF